MLKNCNEHVQPNVAEHLQLENMLSYHSLSDFNIQVKWLVDVF